MEDDGCISKVYFWNQIEHKKNNIDDEEDPYYGNFNYHNNDYVPEGYSLSLFPFIS